MKTKDELNADEMKIVSGGQEPQEFDWQGSGFQTPVKERDEKDEIFQAIGPDYQHGKGKYYEYPEWNKN